MTLGVKPDVNDELKGADELMGAAHQHAQVYICNKPARYAHVP